MLKKSEILEFVEGWVLKKSCGIQTLQRSVIVPKERKNPEPHMLPKSGTKEDVGLSKLYTTLKTKTKTLDYMKNTSCAEIL